MKRLDPALLECRMQFGGEYYVAKDSDDGSDREIVALREDLGRERLPGIQEPTSSWSNASISVWWESIDLILSLRQISDGIEVALVFLVDVLETPGHGVVIAWMVAFLRALGADAAILCDENDESSVGQGSSLSGLILARVTSPHDLPIIALVRQELVEPTLMARARTAGARVELMFGAGVVLFSRNGLASIRR